MFIEYDLRLNQGAPERGVINADYIKWIEVSLHGDGYGKSIEIYYDGYETKSIFIYPDDGAFEKVYEAFKKAIVGEKSEIEGIGFVSPLFLSITSVHWGTNHASIPLPSPLDI